jgi:hypothetical protein
MARCFVQGRRRADGTVRGVMRARTMVVGCMLLGAVACTKTLDSGGLEDQIRSLLQQRGGPSVESVSCPDDVKVQAGSTFSCTASGDGTTWTIDVTQTDDEGNVKIQVARPSP